MCARLAELVRCDHWPAPTGATSLASGLEVCRGALPDQIALKLGKRAEEVEHQHPARRGGVDVLGERAEPDTSRRKLADLLNQMAHRAPKTVEFPNHQRVAAAQIGERLGQAEPIGFCTRCVIVEYSVAPGRVQRRTEERRVGKAGVRTCRCRRTPSHYKKQ